MFIIIKLIASNPLNPSTKFEPFMINKKHNKTKKVENISLFKNGDKKGISILWILIGKKYIKQINEITIKNNLFDGKIFIFKSSRNPIVNIKRLIKI